MYIRVSKKIYVRNEDHEYDIKLIHRRIYIYGYDFFYLRLEFML